MNASDLAKILYDWSSNNYGAFPPYWVLSSSDFRNVIRDLMTYSLRYPLDGSEENVKSFRFMDCIIVPYDHALPREGEQWEIEKSR